ncbi:MAG TPA: hypothetical protein VGI99_15135 [Gemmataceae bacterium]
MARIQSIILIRAVRVIRGCFFLVLLCVILVPCGESRRVRVIELMEFADAIVKLDYEEPMNAADWPAPLLATAAANRYDNLTPRSARSH